MIGVPRKFEEPVGRAGNYRRQELSLLSIIGWNVIGWENLTPQGIRFGIATVLALLAVGRRGRQP